MNIYDFNKFWSLNFEIWNPFRIVTTCGYHGIREHKIAVLMSCGKNFAVSKTAGREIPWQTPDAPNNIIHVRLATGSVVEQMNAHPFARLHTAWTHNGETTNYEVLKQRVEQLNCDILEIMFLSNVRCPSVDGLLMITLHYSPVLSAMGLKG